MNISENISKIVKKKRIQGVFHMRKFRNQQNRALAMEKRKVRPERRTAERFLHIF